MQFTGVKDTDNEFLHTLPDDDLFAICKVNKYFEYLCNDDAFWRRKIIDRIGDWALSYTEDYKDPREQYEFLVYDDISMKYDKVDKYIYEGADYEADLLMEQGAEKILEYTGKTPTIDGIGFAIAKGHIALAEKYMKDGILPIKREYVEEAINSDNLEAVKYLYSIGNIVDEQTLQYAIRYDKVDIVDWIVNMVPVSIGSIRFSIFKDALKVFKYFVDRGDIKVDYNTLTWAVEADSAKIIGYLLSRGLYVDDVLLSKAKNNPKGERVITELYNRGLVKPSEKDLIYAIENNNLDRIKELVEVEGISVDNPIGHTDAPWIMRYFTNLGYKMSQKQADRIFLAGFIEPKVMRGMGIIPQPYLYRYAIERDDINRFIKLVEYGGLEQWIVDQAYIRGKDEIISYLMQNNLFPSQYAVDVAARRKKDIAKWGFTPEPLRKVDEETIFGRLTSDEIPEQWAVDIAYGMGHENMLKEHGLYPSEVGEKLRVFFDRTKGY